MTPSQRSPSVVGCAVGFAFTGSGVGAWGGAFLGGRVWHWLPEGERTPTLTETVYLWMFRGLLAGVLLGAWAGIAYARTVRRRRANAGG